LGYRTGLDSVDLPDERCRARPGGRDRNLRRSRATLPRDASFQLSPAPFTDVNRCPVVSGPPVANRATSTVFD
jgi:hypothetical protein